MAQCKATAKTPGRPNFGKQCQRSAVNGSTFCERHGGVQDSKKPASIRRKVAQPGVRCHVTKRHNGEQCKNYAIPGGTVCRKHGGNAAHVRAKAQERMFELVSPALAQLQRILTKADTSDADRLRAITLLLDRTGYGMKSEVSVEVKPWEALMQAGTILKQIDPSQLVIEAEVVDDVEDAVEVGSPAFEPPRFTPQGVPPRLRIVPKEGSASPPPHQR